MFNVLLFFIADDEVEFCDFRNVHNMSHPATKHVYDQVMAHCRPFGPCYTDCRKVVSDLVKMPCYHGNLWEWSRNKIAGKETTNETVEWMKFYAAVDSCAKETRYGSCETSAASLMFTSHFELVYVVLCVSYLTSIW